MEKFFAMHVAAQLTQAACGLASAPLDPELKDPAVRARNLQVWETFRVFYRGVIGALADAQSWPAPSGTILGDLTKLLGGPGSLIEVVQKLIGAIPTPPAIPKGPLPDPGATVK